MIYESRLSKRVLEIKPSAIRKFFDLANERKGQVISLSIGEPDFVTPWGILDAGIRSLEQGKTHYSPNQGYQELRQEVLNYLARRFDYKYQEADVLATVGGSEAIDLCFRALLNEGDEVIIPEPSFVAYKAGVSLAGGKHISLPCYLEDDFKIKPENLEKAITPKTKLLVLAFPSNPTGAMPSKAELLEIAKIVKKHDLLVLSDELYIELTYLKEAASSFAALPKMAERTILVGGFSKAFAMTGWRIGYAAGPKELIAAMNKIHQYTIMSAPTTAQYAVIEALKNSEKYIAPMRSKYNLRRKFIIKSLEEMGLKLSRPSGAFYIFPDISATGLGSSEFCERLLLEENLAIVPGNAFGECGEGFVRISYASSFENIEEAMKRLRKFLERLT